MESIISRGVLNTRMRDFYDLHILSCLQFDNIDFSLLTEAFKETSSKRGMVISYENILSELGKVVVDAEIKRLWENYRKKFNYAANLDWDDVVISIRKLFVIIKETDKKK